MSNLEKLGKRLDNILKYIKNEKPKDIWIIDNLDILFKEIIGINISREKENMLISKINELLNQYEWRFGETFENLTEGLTPRELEIKNQLYNQYKTNKKEFIRDYGKNAEQVMVGRAIKLAKSMASKEQQQKIKEIIKSALSKGQVDEINSIDYVQNRKPIDKNPIDTVKMDIPLLIRVMEFAREDAKTDMDLHDAAENMIKLSQNGKTLDMKDYNSILPKKEEEQVNELLKSVMKKLK